MRRARLLPGARLFPAFSLVRPTFSVARSWYDSLQASLRMRADARHQLPRVLHATGHAIDHVSGLNIGGEQRPVLPVTIGDDASIDQALAYEKGDALFDVRHRFVVSFGAELPTPKHMGSIVAARRSADGRSTASSRRRPASRPASTIRRPTSAT